MVKIQKLQKDGESDRFLVSDCTRETINAIRRVTMNAVPSMAVETISIYENNSHLFDEYIAHRIGLVPLTTDYKNYKIGEKCELSVEKEGPCTVYSGDFKSEDNKIKPVSDKIPIVKLNKDQKVKIEMNAVMDVGSKNVKYCPAIIGYKEVPDIKDFGDGKNGEKIIKSCPVNVLELKKGFII